MALGHTSLREASKLHVMSKDLPSNRHYVHLPMLPLISHFFISHHKAFNIHEYFPPCGCIISQPWPIKTLNLLIPRFLITFFLILGLSISWPCLWLPSRHSNSWPWTRLTPSTALAIVDGTASPHLTPAIPIGNFQFLCLGGKSHVHSARQLLLNPSWPPHNP